MSDAPEIRIGSGPDGFRLLGNLGQGAMGQVFRALDVELKREVALKFLQRIDHPARLERFRREGEITARLDHPGILRVHGTGVYADRPYVVLELVEGARTLDEAWTDMPLAGCVALIRDAARALGYAHARGVIHRDVKPENLLVDATGRLRVADFGLAAAVGLGRLTVTGALVGTPRYMAPEQIAVAQAELGPWTDVWALGVLLYEAMSGQCPFPAESLVELSAQIVGGDPTPLRGVPDTLVRVCEQALAKDPRRRLQDAGALADGLEAWLEGGDGPRRRSRSLLALGLVGAVVIGAALAAAATLTSGTDTEPALARSSVVDATPELGARTEAEGWRAWEAASQLETAGPRLRAAHDWLRAHSGHPATPQARKAIHELGRQGPLAVIRVVDVGDGDARIFPLWQGEELVLASSQGLTRWSVNGEPRGARPYPRVGFVRRALTLRSGGLALATVRGLLIASPKGNFHEFDVAPSGLATLAESPDGQWIAASADEQGPVQIYSGSDYRLVRTLDVRHDEARALTFTPDSALLLATTGGRSEAGEADPGPVLHGWTTDDWKPAGDTELHKVARAMTICVGRDEMAMGYKTGEILLFPLEFPALRTPPRRLIRPTPGGEGPGGVWQSAHSGLVRQLIYADGGNWLYSLAETEAGGREFCGWDLNSDQVFEVTCDDQVTTMAVTPEGHYVALGTRTGEAYVYCVQAP